MAGACERPGVLHPRPPHQTRASDPFSLTADAPDGLSMVGGSASGFGQAQSIRKEVWWTCVMNSGRHHSTREAEARPDCTATPFLRKRYKEERGRSE